MFVPRARADAALRHGGQALRPVGARGPGWSPGRRWGWGEPRAEARVGGVGKLPGAAPPGRCAGWETQGRPLHPLPRPRQLREPEGPKTSCWQRWQRRQRITRRRLGEAAQRLARGFGLWEGALYEIGGRTCTRTSTSPVWHLRVSFRNRRRASWLASAPHPYPCSHPLRPRGAHTWADDSTPWWLPGLLLGLQDLSRGGWVGQPSDAPLDLWLSASLTNFLFSP